VRAQPCADRRDQRPIRPREPQLNELIEQRQRSTCGSSFEQATKVVIHGEPDNRLSAADRERTIRPGLYQPRCVAPLYL
jgi:hypothetical protein